MFPMKHEPSNARFAIPVEKVRVRDSNELTRALRNRATAQFCNSILRDDGVGVAAGSRFTIPSDSLGAMREIVRLRAVASIVMGPRPRSDLRQPPMIGCVLRSCTSAILAFI
jgi:hypothetical protein